MKCLGAEGELLLLGASGFEQLHQLIQINAAFTLVQFCPPTFKLIYGGEQQREIVTQSTEHDAHLINYLVAFI